MELNKKILDAVKKMVGFIAALFVVVGSRMAVHGLSSELRDLVVVDT